MTVGFASFSEASLLPAGSHCVAYRAKKRLMLVKTVEVIGRNCHVVSQIVPAIGGLYSYKLEVPIDRFESGEEERDKDVKKYLKYDRQDSLYFNSESLPKERWNQIIESQKPVAITGVLNIGGRNHTISAQVKIVKSDMGYEVDGEIITKFENLGIKPPRLFGGLMATVKDDLELHFHLQSDKTLGFDSIL